jgi:hypothetical protein
MTDPSSPLPLSLPIPRSVIDRALRLAQVQPPETSVRVYRNAIAVLIVSNYCTMMGFDVDLEASDALAPALSLTLDTAHLVLTGIGAIECRTVDTDETHCQIPPEACLDRLAYVLIRLDPNSRQADLLGFVATVQNYTIPLAQLQTIDNFGAYLLQLETTKQAQPVALWQWFKGTFQQGWQDLEDWLDQDGNDDTYGMLWPPFANGGVLCSPSGDYNILSEEQDASAVKTIVLGDASDRISLTLNLDLERLATAQSTRLETVQITLSLVVQYQPNKTDNTDTEIETNTDTENQTDPSPNLRPLLPENLRLSIFDLNDRELASDAVFGVLGLESERLFVEFEVSIGTVFTVRMEMDEILVTESFVV